MLVELHMLQNFAPANLNRDDTGAPKDCEFGGFRRARISSQCLKRSMRKSAVFSQTTKAETGERTKFIVARLSALLIDAGKPKEAVQGVLEQVVPILLTKVDKEKTDVLVYLGPAETKRIADAILEKWTKLTGSKKDAEEATKDLSSQLGKDFKDGITTAPDVALFGRMLASKQGLNISVDAASQVAHAISTNKVSMEFDYFTAVDDLQPEGESGSAHLDTTQFNSACFYRYANVDTAQLKRNLGGEQDLALRTIEAFIRASVDAVPTGKQNSFAAQNKPDFILVVVREGTPISLANAFEQPAAPSRDGRTGLVDTSIQKLAAYWDALTKAYGANGLKTKAITTTRQGADIAAFGIEKAVAFDDLVKTVMSGVGQEAK